MKLQGMEIKFEEGTGGIKVGILDTCIAAPPLVAT